MSCRTAEQLARERASQLEAIFEAIPDALFVFDREGRTTRMNAAGQQPYRAHFPERLCGRSICGTGCHVVSLDAHGQRLARESLPSARILAGEVLTPTHAVETATSDRQGEMVALSVTGGPLRDTQGQLVGAVTVCRDITERKRVEQALQQQSQQLQLQAELIERAHDAILVRDPHSQILSWNRGAEQLTAGARRKPSVA